MVTKDPKGYIFYEVKFRKGQVTDNVIQTEIAQVEKTDLHPYKYGFFSRSGFYIEQPGDRLILISLDDLFKLIYINGDNI